MVTHGVVTESSHAQPSPGQMPSHTQHGAQCELTPSTSIFLSECQPPASLFFSTTVNPASLDPPTQVWSPLVTVPLSHTDGNHGACLTLSIRGRRSFIQHKCERLPSSPPASCSLSPASAFSGLQHLLLKFFLGLDHHWASDDRRWFSHVNSA